MICRSKIMPPTETKEELMEKLTITDRRRAFEELKSHVEMIDAPDSHYLKIVMDTLTIAVDNLADIHKHHPFLVDKRIVK